MSIKKIGNVPDLRITVTLEREVGNKKIQKKSYIENEKDDDQYINS